MFGSLWYYMSAPHTYVTDRLCFVISGIWWVNSGENFVPEATVPVPAGGFVRRVAHTPHYDGVKKGGKEPAVIGYPDERSHVGVPARLGTLGAQTTVENELTPPDGGRRIDRRQIDQPRW